MLIYKRKRGTWFKIAFVSFSTMKKIGFRFAGKAMTGREEGGMADR